MANFYNQATLSYNGNTTNSNIVSGKILEAVSATKTAIMPNYVDNDDITYVISIVNSGNCSLKDLTITDNLGAYEFGNDVLVPLDYVECSVHYYVNGVLQAAPSAKVDDGALVISGIDVPAGGNALIIYETEANQYAPLSAKASITNCAVISGAGIPNDIVVKETIRTEDVANLTISKSVCPTTVTENGQITYTFVIQNAGNTKASSQDDVTITDEFNPVLNNIRVTLNGKKLCDPEDYTYDTQTGLFRTVPGRITVPAAKYEQDRSTGVWITNPGDTVLEVTGTI